MNIHISKGNTKLGEIPNISLPPIESCQPSVLCAEGGCYALKAYRTYKEARKNWDENYELYNTDPCLYFDEVKSWIQLEKPELFRWHVGGDIPDFGYFIAMLDTCRKTPDTKHLCFTKNWMEAGEWPQDLTNPWEFVPQRKNLQMVASMWPGMDEPPEELDWVPKFWMQDGTEDRIPDDAVQCFGSCENCGMCWNLGALGHDIWAKKH